jgi:hypothetical protein
MDWLLTAIGAMVAGIVGAAMLAVELRRATLVSGFAHETPASVSTCLPR